MLAEDAAGAAAADAETQRLEDVYVQREAEDLFGDMDEAWSCPFAPSTDARIERLLAYAQLSPRDTLLDLGCGDGRVLIRAAARTGCHCVGVDVDEKLLAAARAEALSEGVSELCSWVEGDFCNTDFSQATVAITYLVPSALKKLLPCLLEHWRAAPQSELTFITMVYDFDRRMLCPTREDAAWKLASYTRGSVIGVSESMGAAIARKVQ